MHTFEIEEIQYEDAVAKRYNRDYHSYPIMVRQDDTFAQYVAQQFAPGDRVLDLGCGPASLWPFWQKYLINPVSLIGVDLSPGMVEECQLLYPDSEFRVGSAFEIPVETGTIDLVIVSSMFHHIPDEHLPKVFSEINRVMDEHGTMVGREPLRKGRLGDEPGWLSGALMAFRHMVYRVTNTREYPEPPIGEYHHAYDAKGFIGMLEKHFIPAGIEVKFPVSAFVARTDSGLVAKLTNLMDESIQHHGGNELHYVAHKNYADAQQVIGYIYNELELKQGSLEKKAEFLALLQKATEMIELAFKEGT
jgi:ubiquinone/menaquinone biosynthesis C-methylase UbiE